jgi:hypothetical protein
VRSADGTLKTQSVTLSAGTEQRLRFEAETSTPQSHDADTAPSGAPASAKTQRTVPWIAWGVTGALGASAAVTGVLALGARADERDVQTRQGVKREALLAARDKVQNLALATDILLAGTLLGAGVSAYFTFRPADPKKSETSLVFAPGSVTLTHSF